MTENQKKLIAVLNEIFQLDQADLDFGIYRIMNKKANEINDFLENNLIKEVKEAFKNNQSSTHKIELESKIKSYKTDGFTDEQVNEAPAIIKLREKLKNNSDSLTLENDVFSHLSSFFKRYYKDGDFISLRRYKKDTYAIPYEGEEVKLHWANSDQYYIKTSEYFRDYSFKTVINTGFEGDIEKAIHFKIIEAETESNNNKTSSDKERRFVLFTEKPLEIIDNELFIYFEYKAIGKEKQDKLNEKAVETIWRTLSGVEGNEIEEYKHFEEALQILAPTEKNKKRTLLEKHLKSYTSRNSFDYFIHKDLGGFLLRELDFYIKNEMLFIDDIEENEVKYNEVMNKIKIFKKVAKKIITFVAQLENLQKKLWEKKKFIIKTDYCITLDKIVANCDSDEEAKELLDDIFSNEEQIKEWESLGFDLPNKNGHPEPVEGSLFDDTSTTLSVREARLLSGAEAYLPLDTKFFNTEFKYKLLSKFDNLDEKTDGVLINSENFGALNLLQERYKEQVKCVYIDPPYNTEQDRKLGKFIYKDNFDSSTWISFMYDRVLYSRNLLNQNGTFFSSLDHNEIATLKNILESVYTKKNFEGLISWRRRHNQPNDKTKMLGMVSEYILSYAKNSSIYKQHGVGKLDLTGDFSNSDNDPKGDWASKPWKVGSDQSGSRYQIVTPTGKVFDGDWMGDENTYNRLYDDGRIYFPKNGNGSPRKKYYRFEREEDGQCATNWWTHDQFGHNQGANDLMTSIFNEKNKFSNPKPIELIRGILLVANSKKNIVLDYFAGSGTTGHATINLNREDGGKRKYILVEMGEYFNTVLKPRIQKVVYSDKWKDGKPVETKKETNKYNGISQMFKYFKLESYEDTLNNLDFDRTAEQTTLLDTNPALKEDYLLNYSLDYESEKSLLNIDNFKDPFNYKLKIATSSVGETKETAVDLVETFNYLLGLVVKRLDKIKSYLIIEGKNLKNERILIIWRSDADNDKLNEFFAKMDWNVYDREFDYIYINGDNNLANLRKDEDHYKIKLIEEEFKRLMFDE